MSRSQTADLLRVVSVFTTISVIKDVISLGKLLGQPMNALLDSAGVHIVVGLGLFLAFSSGPVAAIQLWRFRESGRLAGLVFWVNAGVWVLLSPLLVGTPSIN